MLLFVFGVVFIIQIKVWGLVGFGLFFIQGISFNFVVLLIMGGIVLKIGGVDVFIMMVVFFGILMLVSCIEMVFFWILYLVCCIIILLVFGVVVMIIGLLLIQVGLIFIGGGYVVMVDYIFGVLKNLLLVGIVLVLIIIFNCQCNLYLCIVLLVIVMVVGYLVVWFFDMLLVNIVLINSSFIIVLMLFYYGFGIDWSLLLFLMLVFMIIFLEIIGDIIVIFDVFEQLVLGLLYMKCLKGGVLVNGLNFFVFVVFNIFLNFCFGQNNGVI